MDEGLARELQMKVHLNIHLNINLNIYLKEVALLVDPSQAAGDELFAYWLQPIWVGESRAINMSIHPALKTGWSLINI